MPYANERKEAYLRAYDTYADAIFRYCSFRVYDRERAKELVQETFIRAWEQTQKGVDVESWQAYLFKIATNLVIDESRYRKRRPSESFDALHEKGFDAPARTPSPALSAEAARAVEAIEELPAQDQELIRLRFFAGLGPKDIAEMLGEPENRISVRLHRAIERLRQHYL